MCSNFTYFTFHHSLLEHAWSNCFSFLPFSFLMNPVSNTVLIPIESGYCKASPVFYKGKSECRVRVFVESGFSTGPSPGFVVCPNIPYISDPVCLYLFTLIIRSGTTRSFAMFLSSSIPSHLHYLHFLNMVCLPKIEDIQFLLISIARR